MKQRLGVYVWTGISVVMLGVLMNLFKIKQGGCESPSIHRIVLNLADLAWIDPFQLF